VSCFRDIKLWRVVMGLLLKVGGVDRVVVVVIGVHGKL
jgi:hypothetical protein